MRLSEISLLSRSHATGHAPVWSGARCPTYEHNVGLRSDSVAFLAFLNTLDMSTPGALLGACLGPDTIGLSWLGSVMITGLTIQA